jgi:hypothetical protein
MAVRRSPLGRRAATALAAAVAALGALESARATFQPSSCPSDCALPHDKVVDTSDFLALLKQWGTAGACDVNGNGVINASDFLLLLQHWGACPPPVNDGCDTAHVIDRLDPVGTVVLPFDMYAAAPTGLPVNCPKPAGLCPSSGPCCVAHGGPGCNDGACCLAVCAIDPFCCDIAWDSICAGEAVDLCAACQEDIWYCLNNDSGASVLAGIQSSVNLLIEVLEGCPCDTNPVLECGQGSGTVFLLPGASVLIRLVNNLQLPNEALQGTLTVENVNPFGCPSPNDCCIAHGNAACEDLECCSRVCLLDPFCCDIGWDSICLDEAIWAPECSCCPCGAGNVAENEPCGVDFNGDCSLAATLECGDAVCGSSWAEADAFDIDWYEVFVPDPDGDDQETLRATLRSQFPGVCTIVDVQDSGCLPDKLGIGVSDGCKPLVDATACVPAPGTYFVAVAVMPFEVVPCGSGANRYTLTVACEPCSCGSPGSGSCCEGSFDPGCDNIACCDAVCALDPFCCEIAWDAICANNAELFVECGCTAGAAGR